MYKKIIKFILILLCMFIIFIFSNDNGDKSTKKSDMVIVSTTRFFLGDKLSNKEYQQYIDLFVVPVRKSAHFFIYLVLGMLVISFIKEFRTIDYLSLFMAILICFLYACSDEIHQLFIPGRSGEIGDIFIDTLGSILGIVIYFVCYNRKYICKEKKYE